MNIREAIDTIATVCHSERRPRSLAVQRLPAKNLGWGNPPHTASEARPS